MERAREKEKMKEKMERARQKEKMKEKMERERQKEKMKEKMERERQKEKMKEKMERERQKEKKERERQKENEEEERRDMRGLKAIAEAYHKAGPQRVRDLANNFFDSLDGDGNGKINYNNFATGMGQLGQARNLYSSKHMFKKLNRTGDGILDPSEVRTLFYMISSGRPFCGVCSTFIGGVFFTCVECFQSPQGTFDLCLDCYRNHRGSAAHTIHEVKPLFLDSHTMLFSMRNSAMSESSSKKKKNQLKIPTPAGPLVPHSSPPRNPKETLDIVKAALALTLEVAAGFAGVAAAGCTIL